MNLPELLSSVRATKGTLSSGPNGADVSAEQAAEFTNALGDSTGAPIAESDGPLLSGQLAVPGKDATQDLIDGGQAKGTGASLEGDQMPESADARPSLRTAVTITDSAQVEAQADSLSISSRAAERTTGEAVATGGSPNEALALVGNLSAPLQGPRSRVLANGDPRTTVITKGSEAAQQHVATLERTGLAGGKNEPTQQAGNVASTLVQSASVQSSDESLPPDQEGGDVAPSKRVSNSALATTAGRPDQDATLSDRQSGPRDFATSIGKLTMDEGTRRLNATGEPKPTAIHANATASTTMVEGGSNSEELNREGNPDLNRLSDARSDEKSALQKANAKTADIRGTGTNFPVTVTHRATAPARSALASDLPPHLQTGASATTLIPIQVAETGAGTSVAAQKQSAVAFERTIAPQITAAITSRPNGGVIDLRLDPPDLGRIEILMELGEQGLRATLTAERSATGDLLRRNADSLLQQFEDAGFSDIDLNFSDGDGSNTPAFERSKDAVLGSNGVVDEQPQKFVDQKPERISSTGVDIRL